MHSVLPTRYSGPTSRGAAASRLLALATVAVLLAGCVPAAVTPNVALDVPSAYRYAGKTGGLQDHATDWWSGFRSAELTRLMEETEIANFDIAAAIGRVKQADAQASQSGAALLPSISASDSFTRSASSTSTSSSSASLAASGLGSSFSSGPRNDLIASFSASYQLDFWGKNRATFVAAQDNATASRWDRQTVTLTSLASTATTYYTILSARERIAFAKQDVVDSSRILKLIQDRVKFGTATSLQEAQQAALVANLKASIPPLQVTVDQNIAALAILLGRAPERVDVAGKSVLDAHVPVIAPGIPSEVLTQRPDVQNAEFLLSSEHASLVAARAAFFPTITLTAQGGFESLALRTLFSPASTFYSAAASLAQPIFDGGLLQGQFDQVKGRQDELLADYKKTVVTAFSDVDKALTALRLLAQQEELTRESLVASRKAYELSEDQLKNGVLDVVTLLQTEQTLFTTQDTLTQVRLSRLTEAVALYQALGGAYAVKVKSGS
ncbi:efflux transporter outer membrane subunit [Beijerinckia sp. L45]|uniref:efflux transporter outer membrane subunit n=1 Tax=Beijerinckia sp. L45 TaxID=1641855 RepID=UPI00131C0D60|nr:efflux transporter outer membrane subunit [Beijerinckia sp. L45]